MGEITVTRTSLPGVLLVKPQHFIDSRGFHQKVTTKTSRMQESFDEFVR